MTKPFSPALQWLGLLLAVTGLTLFLALTPGGLLRKTDYVAAVVCHRRPAHSFFIGDYQLPLCQRCSGTFPGALTGVLVHWAVLRRRRSMRFPAPTFAVLFGLFAVFWGLDGINSATSEQQFSLLIRTWAERPAGAGLLGYAPQPWLRLLTGTLMGLAMSAVLVPAFNQTMWADGEDLPALRTWGEFVGLLIAGLGISGLLYLRLPLLLYPVVFYSTAGVLLMFVLLGAMLFVLTVRRDATLRGWRAAWVPLLWGIVFALVLIGFILFVRLRMTGTIDGVPGLP